MYVISELHKYRGENKYTNLDQCDLYEVRIFYCYTLMYPVDVCKLLLLYVGVFVKAFKQSLSTFYHGKRITAAATDGGEQTANSNRSEKSFRTVIIVKFDADNKEGKESSNFPK